MLSPSTSSGQALSTYDTVSPFDRLKVTRLRKDLVLNNDRVGNDYILPRSMRTDNSGEMFFWRMLWMAIRVPDSAFEQLPQAPW